MDALSWLARKNTKLCVAVIFVPMCLYIIAHGIKWDIRRLLYKLGLATPH